MPIVNDYILFIMRTHKKKGGKREKRKTNNQDWKKNVNKLSYFDSSLSLSVSLWAYINGLSLVCKCARLCEWLQAVYYSSPEGLGSIWPRIWHSAPSINAATTPIFYQRCLSSACRVSSSLHLSGFAVFLFSPTRESSVKLMVSNLINAKLSHV